MPNILVAPTAGRIHQPSHRGSSHLAPDGIRVDRDAAPHGRTSRASRVAVAVACLAVPLALSAISTRVRAQSPTTDSPAPAPADSGVDHAAMTDPHATHRMPEGYLGITFLCDVRRQYGPEGLTIYHYGYPAVAFVQPGSPADQAGIVAGDTIVAYDARDVLYRKIVLSRLLRPGSRLAVRIRRNGTIKNLNVSITPRPSSFVDMRDMSVAGLGGTPLSQSGGSASLDPRQWIVLSTPLPPLPPAATDDSLGVSIGTGSWPAGSPRDAVGAGKPIAAAIAGAQFVRTNADLQDALGVEGGVLVLSVSEGSAAAHAGLRAGDVVVTARGDAVDSPQSLVRVVHRAEQADESVELRVVRRHQTRTVVVK